MNIHQTGKELQHQGIKYNNVMTQAENQEYNPFQADGRKAVKVTLRLRVTFCRQ